MEERDCSICQSKIGRPGAISLSTWRASTGLPYFLMALTAYEAAVAAKPKEKITLRHGAARSAIDAPTDGPLPRVAGRSAQIEECRADVAAQAALVVLEPLAARDGHDLPGLIDERVPGVAAVVDDIVGGFEDPV
jgi:hypothetical protein